MSDDRFPAAIFIANAQKSFMYLGSGDRLKIAVREAAIFRQRPVCRHGIVRGDSEMARIETAHARSGHEAVHRATVNLGDLAGLRVALPAFFRLMQSF